MSQGGSAVARSSTGESQASPARTSRRLTRLAILIGSVSIVVALAVGWIAYHTSQDALTRGFLQSHLNRTRTRASMLDLRRTEALDEETLRDMRELFLHTPQRFPNTSMSVIGADGRLLVDTAHPEREGQDILSLPFKGQGAGAPSTFGDLIRSKRDWVGFFESHSSQVELAAFARSERHGAIVGVYMPWAEIREEIIPATLPWTAGFALFALICIPMSLWLMHRAHRSSEAAARTAEAELRQSQARLASAVESMPFDFWICDAEGRFVMQNAPSIRRFGNQIGKRLDELDPSPAAAALCRSFEPDNRRAFAGEEVRSHYETTWEDEKRFYERIAAPIRDGQRTIGILCVHLDMTQARRAQEKLDAALRRLEFHVENSPLAVIEWDREFRVIRWSAQAERVFGWKSEEVLGKHALEWAFVHEADRARIGEVITRLDAGTERRNTSHNRNYSKSGAVLDCEWHNSALLDAEGKLVSILSLVLDVTARTRAEVAQARLSEELRALHGIGQAIISGLSLQGIVHSTLRNVREIVACDRASLILLDESSEEAQIFASEGFDLNLAPVGLRVPVSTLDERSLECARAGKMRLLLGAELENTQPAVIFKELVRQGLHALVYVPVISKGKLLGSLNLSLMRVASFRDEDLKFAREVADFLATALEQARLHDQVQQQANELERRVVARTARLIEVNEELENYVRSVSHDLRAPLRAIHGFGIALQEDCSNALPDTGREYLARMVGAAERMDGLMQDLLAYSRLGRELLHSQPIDTLAIVRDAAALVSSELEERAARVDIEEPLLPVVGHAATLTQVVANLLSNAAKFVAPGVAPRIRVRTQGRDGWVRLCIEDNGIGIAPEHQERIFRVFERLHGDETYPGTGIGLAVVRRAVERMGGSTGVDSELEEGSRFWLELRAAELPSRVVTAEVESSKSRR